MPHARLILAALTALALVAPAHALDFGPDAPLALRIFGDTLLWTHIAGGAAGILTGAAALAVRKGGRLHRRIGLAFVIAMTTSYAVAAAVAPFSDDGQRPNFIAGVLALYLLISGWMTARQRQTTASAWTWAGLAFSLAILTSGLIFMQMGAASPTGTVDGSPPDAFFLFTIVGAFSAAGEVHLLVRRELSRLAHVVRHLWRMCCSLFIATGSFFLGQMQVLPEPIRDSAWPYVLAFLPLLALLVWQILTRLDRRYRRVPAPAA
jgi:hypothetical protein